MSCLKAETKHSLQGGNVRQSFIAPTERLGHFLIVRYFLQSGMIPV